MAKSSESLPAAEAVDEAIRTLTEASSASAATAQRAVANSRSVLTEAIAVNRQLLHAWSAGMEATFKAGCEAQSGLFAAAPPLLESSLPPPGAWSRRGRRPPSSTTPRSSKAGSGPPGCWTRSHLHRHSPVFGSGIGPRDRASVRWCSVAQFGQAIRAHCKLADGRKPGVGLQYIAR